MALVYHGTPVNPRAAFDVVMPGRACCISFYDPRNAEPAEQICPFIMYDNGAFSFWQKAMKTGIEWDQRERDWTSFYAWLEQRIYHPGRWAVVPDRPGAPSQLNDALLKEWPFGRSKGAPLWHMDGPVDRLLRLCDEFDRVCFGWIGEFDPVQKRIVPEQKAVGCDAYRRKMDQVARALGNRWPPVHMMRGIAVGSDYPFVSADATSLAQNGHRHDWHDAQHGLFGGGARQWDGRRRYADSLEALAA